MDCSPPGSSIHGIFQAKVLEWGAIAFSEKSLRTTILKLSYTRGQGGAGRAGGERSCPATWTAPRAAAAGPGHRGRDGSSWAVSSAPRPLRLSTHPGGATSSRLCWDTALGSADKVFKKKKKKFPMICINILVFLYFIDYK